MNLKVATLGGQVGCLTLGIVLASVFGGLWLDNFLGTKPVLTIILLLASAPVSLVLTFLVVTRSMKDINMTLPKGTQAMPRKEEDSDS